MWKSIGDLTEPFNDAVNYRSRQEKEFFNKVFLKTDHLGRIVKPSTYYVMGEKGTGKTAYATYMENNSIDENRCKLVTLTETQYKRFIAMKKEGRLAYSDYASIWRSTLLLLVAEMYVDKNKGLLHSITGKCRKVEEAIARWNSAALNPEVEGALELLTSDSLTALIKAAHVGHIGAEQMAQQTQKSSVLRHHLLETESFLKEAIGDLRLPQNHILFIDGIDYRPEQVAYGDYLQCIKGLGEAAWQLNTEYFNKIRDSKGRTKIVLLLRPDVFHNLNLYNSNSKIQDNTALLSWATTEQEVMSSDLYQACAKFLASQQAGDRTPNDAWKNYFPPEAKSEEHFKRLLRLSFQRPRDILTFIRLLRAQQVEQGNGGLSHFDSSLMSSPRFSRDSSDYLLGEVRNYSAFYMPPEDFGNYLKFFQYLDGRRKTSMEEFSTAHKKFVKWAKGEQFTARDYLRDPEAMLQLFYDVNIIGYKEVASATSEPFFHWSFRERSLNNIAPKIKNVGELMINIGIAKALDIGKQMEQTGPRTPPRNRHRQSPLKSDKRRPRPR